MVRSLFQHVWRSLRDDSLVRKVTRNASYLLSSSMIASGLGFVQSVVVARALGVGNYGLWAMITTYVMFVRQIVDFRVWETVTRYVSEFWVAGDKARTAATVKLAYLIDLLTGVLSFLIAIAAVPIAARLLHQPTLAAYVWIVALGSLFTTINGTSLGILRVFDRFTWISYEEVGRSVFSLAIVSAAVFLGLGLTGIAAAYTVTSLASGIVLTMFSLSVVRRNLSKAMGDGKISLLRDRYREIAGFLFHTNVNALWPMITRSLDILILGHFRSSAETGYFHLAKNFASLVVMIQDPLYYSIFPEITKLWAAGDSKAFFRFLRKLTVLTMAAFIPLGVVITLVAGPFVNIVYGIEYANAVPALYIMVWGVIAAGIAIWMRPVVIAIGKPHVGNIVGGIGAALFVIGSLIAVPVWGYLGSAVLFVVPKAAGVALLGWYLTVYFRRHGGGIE